MNEIRDLLKYVLQKPTKKKQSNDDTQIEK